ncbi:Isoleucine--tRNA ligase [Apiospora hydei]|uniref:isoleucine--tRNA ligase n=1 Tax=Apiospora hydei TaxID=1337664 RepID=A0ABR1VXU5_9PEZI
MSKKWTATLRLPKSTFPARPLPQLKEQYVKRSADDYYEWQKSNRPADDQFILHDGPPYANGNLHVGHALNKILKDMILRVQIQQGRQVDYVPGWDCHGLPIELKAIEKSDGKQLSAIETRKVARNLATNTVLKQMKSFRSYGVMGDWDRRWTTMDAAYEIRQLRLFQKMVKKGLIYRRYKPVYWSPSSKSALAEAELEYRDDHVSNAAWVRFPIDESWRTHSPLAPLAESVSPATRLYAVIWTTTPWTLPANQAIAVHDDLDRVESSLAKVPGKVSSVTIQGRQLKGLKYTNPAQGKAGRPQPIIHADFVSADSGTGLVHLAPGHGFDDYEVCRGLGLPITAPINNEGVFTQEAYPDDPSRLTTAPSVIDGASQAVIDLLGQDILASEKYQHKYPYDWRTKRPVVIRATEQWFADVASIKDEALAALENVRFVPESGKNRLSSFVKGRSEWCISRQRAWGVPIPALYDSNGAAIVSEEIVGHIIGVIQERGINAWYMDELDDPAWIPTDLHGRGYSRGTDTMDVWFDSGSSWSMMPAQADVYLEGSDQHRGWFQSSLLTRIAAGAVEEGKKMSKSLGNVMEPHQVMDGTLLPPMKLKGKAAQGPPQYDALGADALRLWAASSDYTRDVVISVPVLSAIHTALVKYRTIIKMLLGSMHESARSAPLSATDHVAIVQLQDTMQEVEAAFANHEFYKGFNAINRWVNNDFSAFYLEALKDRLYCGDGGGVLEPILNGFLRMLAPMTPSLVEEAWDHRPNWLKQDTAALHPLQQLYNEPLVKPSRLTLDLDTVRSDIPVLMTVHAAIKAGLERARSDKVLGQSLQSSVILAVPDEAATVKTVLDRYAQELDVMFVVSSVNVNAPVDGQAAWKYEHEFEAGNGHMGTATVLPPRDVKCPRCWRYIAPVEDQLCGRCEDVVGETKV